MNIYSVLFFILAAIILASTLMAITRRNALHAVVYLIISFIATGLIFYLLGAPFLALLEIIVYAGAIMVLFLFIVMILQIKPRDRGARGALQQWSPAIILGGVTLILGGIMVFTEPGGGTPLKVMSASPLQLGRFLFQTYWFPVEIASFLLLIALVGALYLGRDEKRSRVPHEEGS